MTDTDYNSHTTYHNTIDDNGEKYHDGQVADPMLKIEIMRKRVEAQLESLMQGNDFQILRQQVAELRQPHPHFHQPMDENSVHILEETFGINQEESEDFTQQFNTSSSSTRMENRNFLEPLKALPMDDRNSVSSVSDVLSTVTASTMATTASASSAILPRAIDFVRDVELRDPYGDVGRYTGEVINQPSTQPHGTGHMKYNDGRFYSGGWHFGQWHGKGTCTFANGDKFDGTYDKDRRHGFGSYCWSDGRVYEGEFYLDQRQGCGEYRWPNSAVYRGEFVAGHRQGEGTYSFADGSTYTGEWHKGRYHGVGQCIWSDGRVYRGEWRSGKAHGFGVEKRSDGTIRHEGTWDSDIPVRK